MAGPSEQIAMNRIPLSRAAQLLPFLGFLDGIGAPVERSLLRHGLSPGLQEDPLKFISTRSMAAVVWDMAKREGVDAFGWRTAASDLSQISSGLTRILLRSPTLLHAMRAVSALVYRESTEARICLAERGDEVYICHQGSLERQAPGVDEMTMLRAANIIFIVRLFTAPDWIPSACGFAIDDDLGRCVRDDLHTTHIVRAPDYSWIRLPRSILAQPLRAGVNAQARPGGRPDEPSPSEMGDWVARVLRAHLSDRVLSIQEVAELASTSVRSLQRELAGVGSSFRELLQQSKLECAIDLLKDPEARVRDVATATGFTDPGHFVRFFRRLTGVTPGEFRASQARD
jgi:AraC-like DNA-binding protein